MSEFKIDFFELCFLAEACIPPRPIARAIFWNKLINVYYDQMTPEERTKIFKWLGCNLDLRNEQCLAFYNKFNPNQ